MRQVTTRIHNLMPQINRIAQAATTRVQKPHKVHYHNVFMNCSTAYRNATLGAIALYGHGITALSNKMKANLQSTQIKINYL